MGYSGFQRILKRLPAWATQTTRAEYSVSMSCAARNQGGLLSGLLRSYHVLWATQGFMEAVVHTRCTIRANLSSQRLSTRDVLLLLTSTFGVLSLTTCRWSVAFCLLSLVFGRLSVVGRSLAFGR